VTGPSRIPGTQFGRLIDRSRTLNFTFDGKPYRGFHGDTLASALLANGVSVTGRSAKFHRPRGVFAIGPEDPNAFVSIDGAPGPASHVNATTVQLVDGLQARSQNAWPSLRWDALEALDRLRPLFPAGSRFKTLRRPGRLWPLAERALRHLAGSNRPVRPDDRMRTEHVYAETDLLIIGGGLAGLAAAEAAASLGVSVVIAEQSSHLGGIADAYDGQIDGLPIMAWARARTAELAARAGVHLLSSTTAVTLEDDGCAILLERTGETAHAVEPEHVPQERLWKLRARAVVLATGALERPLVFPGNDRPGTMLATSARLFLRRYAVTPGTRVAIAASGDEGYRTAFDLQAAGVAVERIVDLRLNPDGALHHIAKARGFPVSPGSAPVGMDWSRKTGISSVTIANRLTLEGPALRQIIACDALLVSGGWHPLTDLAARRDSSSGLFLAGASNGITNAAAVVEDGRRAAADVASYLHRASSPAVVRPDSGITEDEPAETVGMLPDTSTAQEQQTAFVDFRTDVTALDLAVAKREGYGTAEQLRLYTGFARGDDGGKLARAAASTLRFDSDMLDLSATTTKFPATSLSLASVAGARQPAAKILRTTPLSGLLPPDLLQPHHGWLLPVAFPASGETHEDAVRREVRAMRSGLGIFDASAAPSLLILGPDAEAFLEFASPSDIAKTSSGRSQKVIVLDDDGFVVAEADLARRAAGGFRLVGGIGHGAGLVSHLRNHSLKRPDLRISIIDETEAWGRLVIGGPRVPELLSHLPTSFDAHAIEEDAVLEGHILGEEAFARASRHSGSPEIEIAVRSGVFASFWNTCVAAVPDVVPIGVDARDRLRLEAGAIDLDHDTDGTLTPHDLGFDVRETPGFVGQAGLKRPAFHEAGRRTLVGLLMDDPQLIPPAGAQLVINPDQAPPRRSVGYVTSSGYSPTLRRGVALALISAGDRHLGGEVFIIQSGEGKRGTIANRHFLIEGAAR
jgi:sarcosine oxidase, subunit alpha